jgi:hypothetical protein
MAIMGLVSIVSELRAERTNLVTQLKHVDAALSVLGKLNGGTFDTEPRRTLSPAARRKISLAQKARWAKRASTNGQVVAVKPEKRHGGGESLRGVARSLHVSPALLIKRRKAAAISLD